MNVSAKSEYGLRALVHLHRAGLSGLTPAREIAGACGVPLKYLEQILRVLKDGGLVEAQVGIAGGYRLSRPGSLITAGEAIRLLDERLGLGSVGWCGCCICVRERCGTMDLGMVKRGVRLGRCIDW